MRWRTAALAVAAVALCASSAQADDTAAIGAITTTTLSTPDGDGGFDHYGTGGGASILYLFYDSDIVGGFEAGTLFITGEERRLYDLGLSMIVSPGMKDGSTVPFLRVGLDLAAVSESDGDARRRKVMAGVHGGLGLHGHLTGKLVWRAEVGYHGAGVGGITGQLGLGYIFGD
jgi:hypothetical protein